MFDECEKAAREHDPDRFFAALFAPEDKRVHLFCLTALYYELAHAAEAAREPMLAQIRLAWWRETIELAREGRPRDHPVAKALAATLAAHDLPADLFESIIAARTEQRVFADAAAAAAYADATVGSLMRLWAGVLGGETPLRDAAIAYGLAGRNGGAFGTVDTNALATAHFAAARATAYPRAILPAVLPAALVPLYLQNSNPPLWRRQLALFVAGVRGRL